MRDFDTFAWMGTLEVRNGPVSPHPKTNYCRPRLQEFETAYKEAVCAKRLSGSKVTNLTEMVMTLMKVRAVFLRIALPSRV